MSVLASETGTPVTVVDAGVRGAPPIDGVRRLDLAPSQNLAETAALSAAQLHTALAAGRALAGEADRKSVV